MIKGLVAADRVDPSKAFEPLVRSRLVQRFVRAAAHSITVVAAPAGFGKTVAVKHFLESAEFETRRYTLHAEDASLEGFVHGFLAAVVPPAADTMEFSRLSTGAGKSRSSAPTMARRVAQMLQGRPETIVVDNLHVAGAEALAFLLALVERNETSRWIFVTRNPLDLPVATWLAYCRMDMPIDEIDLALSSDETLEIARDAAPQAAQAEVQKLWDLTAGWPTAVAFGIRLLARSPRLERIQSTLREMVFGYFSEQIFKSLTQPDRDFLLKTAFLPSLRVEQLRARGHRDAAPTLSRLQRLTGFLTPEGDGAFTYQSLFREFLQYQLQIRGKLESEAAEAFAAEALDDEGRFSEALELYCNLHELDAVRRILVVHGAELIARGALEPVTSGLMAFSAKERETPELLALAADVKARQASFVDAVALFKRALVGLPSGDARAAIASRLLVALCDQQDYQQAAEILEKTQSQPVRDGAVKAGLVATEAFVRSRCGAKFGEVRHLLQEASELAALTDRATVRADVMYKAAEVELQSGLLEEAERDASVSLALAEGENLSSLAARSALVLARAAAEQSDHKRTAWSASLALRHAEAAQDRGTWLGALAELARVAAQRYDSDRLSEIERTLKSFPTVESSASKFASALALRLAWNGDFAAAKELLRKAPPDADRHRMAVRCSELALFAAAANERETAEEAIRAWQDRSGALEGGGSFGAGAVLSRIWIALASLLLGRAAVANNLLREVERGSREIAAPLRELAGLARAAYVQAETGSAKSDVARALDATRQAGLAGYARLLERLPLPDTSLSPRFGSLTKTEVKVLRLLAAGLTSKSIGAEVGRSPQTIDSHVKAVIRKLGCSGRHEAIVLARHHGII